MKYFWISVLIFALGSCIPIPWNKNYLKRPELTICVSDTLGNPSVASVQLTRSFLPHGADSVFTFATNADGCVYLKRIIEGEIIMPLMMHGVHQYAFSMLIKTDVDSTYIYCQQWTRDVSDKEDILSYFEYHYDSLKVHMVDSNSMHVILN